MKNPPDGRPVFGSGSVRGGLASQINHPPPGQSESASPTDLSPGLGHQLGSRGSGADFGPKWPILPN